MSIPVTGIFVRRARQPERALVQRPVSFVCFLFCDFSIMEKCDISVEKL